MDNPFQSLMATCPVLTSANHALAASYFHHSESCKHSQPNWIGLISRATDTRVLALSSAHIVPCRRRLPNRIKRSSHPRPNQFRASCYSVGTSTRSIAAVAVRYCHRHMQIINWKLIHRKRSTHSPSTHLHNAMRSFSSDEQCVGEVVRGAITDMCGTHTAYGYFMFPNM